MSPDHVFEVTRWSMCVTISSTSPIIPRPICVHHWVCTFQVRLAAAVMCKSFNHFNVQGGRYAGQQSTQVEIARIFKPVCYKLTLHSKPCSGSAAKAHSTKQEVKVTAPIAARPELGLERPASRVMPGLRGRGIGQRWVEARRKDHGRGDAGTERTVCSSTAAVRKSRRGARNIFPARAGNSW